MLCFTPSEPTPEIAARSPAVSTTRYDGILGVRWKAVVAVAPCTVRVCTGMFDTAVHAAGSVTVSWYVARNAGSSQPGNMRRASVDSNCVASMRPVRPSGVR